MARIGLYVLAYRQHVYMPYVGDMRAWYGFFFGRYGTFCATNKMFVLKPFDFKLYGLQQLRCYYFRLVWFFWFSSLDLISQEQNRAGKQTAVWQKKEGLSYVSDYSV